MLGIPGFIEAKASGRRIAMLTCYDALSAAILARSGVDAVLVGDSAAMVVHGSGSTLSATVGLIELHTRAVRAGATDLCVVADMPFLSTRKGIPAAVRAAGRLMVAGANAVKIEGLEGHERIIPHLIASGVPVMGHLGLTPQSHNVLGGYRVQGAKEDAAARILSDARRLEELGAFALVLECVPSALAARVSAELSIPTIGIGAGAGTDGQILVLQDMLGLGSGPRPRFVRAFAEGAALVEGAVRAYAAAVRDASFPSAAESYGAKTAGAGNAPGPSGRPEVA